MPASTIRRRSGLLALVVTASVVLPSPGCSALPGLITGAFTGAVDAPMQVYRYHRVFFDRNPIYWTFNALFIGPLGFACGPIVGFAKGIALDVKWLLDQTDYGDVFGTYRDMSIWRPYTIHW